MVVVEIIVEIVVLIVVEEIVEVSRMHSMSIRLETITSRLEAIAHCY